jgi:hypothetical protein
MRASPIQTTLRRRTRESVRMKFFFPDSQDLVDPSFDFTNETRSETRVRQRDDLYAHELFSQLPYDGLLVSKAIVDGTAAGAGKYTLAQRHRLFRLRARAFFRIPQGSSLEIMGDCGAFSYVREEAPPYSVDEVIDFYEACGFDAGVSVDHVILEYDKGLDSMLGDELVPAKLLHRQALTLELAEAFLRRHKARKCKFTPLGVAQGWSPDSYALAISTLQRIGYRRIAIGGLVPLKTGDLRDVIRQADSVRGPNTSFHLLGVNRLDHMEEFGNHGVTSFDTTSPLRRAFKDDKDNYFTRTRTYTAIRVPQVDANTKLQRRIVAGQVDQGEATRLERACLEALTGYDRGEVELHRVLAVLRAYEIVHDGRTDRTNAYRAVLTDSPWKACECDVCRELGIHVVIFRGAERNRRRGFHNIYIFNRRLHSELQSISRATKPDQLHPMQHGQAHA